MNECPFILLTAGEGSTGPAKFAEFGEKFAEFTETDSRRHPPPAPAADFFSSLMNECTFTSTRLWRDSTAARPKAVPRAVPRAVHGRVE